MKKFYFSVILLHLLVCRESMYAQIISTIAGSGTQGYNGDNLAASIAYLNKPSGMVSDNSGNIFIADFLNNRIRKVGTNGFITTVGGTGMQGYNGDNIAANAAQLYNAEAVAVDQAGNIYLADGNNNRIRKISTSGIITTIAGTGTFGYNGDNIAATIAQVNYPSDGIIIDAAGNIYFSDTFNNRVRKINTSGIITTIAGTGIQGFNGDNIAATAAQLNHPLGLAMDTDGNLYIADGLNQRIRKINTSGFISTLAGSGTAGYNGDNMSATISNLYNPTGVVVDAAGNVFIADTQNNRVRKVSSTGIITTIAGNGTGSYNGDNIQASTATLNFPNSVSLDVAGNLLIADLANQRVRKITNAGVILPLSLTMFKAQIWNGACQLLWQTSNEQSVRKFIVENSSDGIAFSEKGNVDAKNTSGNNNYAYTDNFLQTGITYYRLKMVDINGNFSYSSIATIKVGNKSLLLNVSPNPVSSVLNVSFNTSIAGNYTVQIVDLSGKILRQINKVSIAGINKLYFELNSFSKGSYFISVISPEKEKITTQFIKN